MRLRCKKEDLLKALNKVGSIASDKTPLPILSYLVMETRGDKLRLAASDLKVGIETFVDVRVEEEGEVALPAKKIEAIIRELPKGEVAIDTQKNNSVLINSGSSHFRLMGTATDDFPVLPEIKNGVKLEISGEELKEIIKHTSFAISHDERMSILNGIYFKVGEGVLKVVATDGRRMAYICRQVDTKDTSVEVIVPEDAIDELGQIVDEDAPCRSTFSEKQVVFSSKETRFVSRLVEGAFPDYEKIIPKTFKSKMRLNRQEFLASLRRMALLSGERATAVRFDIGKKKVVFSIVNPELGEGREEMACEGEVEPMTILFNPFYIIDFLKNNNSEFIDLQFNDALSATVFKPVTQENYLYFLMPVKL